MTDETRVTREKRRGVQNVSGAQAAQPSGRRRANGGRRGATSQRDGEAAHGGPELTNALILGRLSVMRSGNAFLRPTDPMLKEIFVPVRCLNTAMHEDEVAVRIETSSRERIERFGDRPTGKVVRIEARRRATLVGTLVARGGHLELLPDDARIQGTVRVAATRKSGPSARAGDKVVVELVPWSPRTRTLEGRVVENLGKGGADGVDMLAVRRQYGLPDGFSHEVLDAARSLGDSVRLKDLANRQDRRDDFVVTIDPEDARDLDDAFSLERMKGSGWLLLVHVADVAHYVKPGSPLDLEARRRGNSTYLVDGVVPMLPEGLSNGLCSLHPGVDRLTNCVELHLTEEGRVTKTRLFPSVIRSKLRLSYEDAAARLRKRPSDPVSRLLHDASRLAQRVRRRRFEAGALPLDVVETKLRLDPNGRVVRIDRVESDESHQLIEEFMLLANEAVASSLIGRRVPAMHRVHEEPEFERLERFRAEAALAGVLSGDLQERSEVLALLTRLDRIPAGPVLRVSFMKALARARYSMEPLGHYGLAKLEYLHFTSPIRRYADLTVHRALYGRGLREERALVEVAEHLSETERNSAEAERESKLVKLLAYLAEKGRSGGLGRLEAVVVSARDRDVLVEVPDLGLGGRLETGRYTRRTMAMGKERKPAAFKAGDVLVVEVRDIDARHRSVVFSHASRTTPLAKDRPQRSARRVNPRKPATG